MDVKKKSAIAAYIKTFGNITQACQILGIDNSTFHRWKQKDKKFAKALEDAQPKERDFLESKAVSRINKGSDSVLIFALKTKAKSRGWVDQDTGADGKPLVLNNFNGRAASNLRG